MQQVSIYLSTFEGHKTMTRYGVSCAIKLTLVKFINVGIIPVVVNWDFKYWFHPYGLTEDTFFNVLFWVAGEVLFVFFEPYHFIRIVR